MKQQIVIRTSNVHETADCDYCNLKTSSVPVGQNTHSWSHFATGRT